MPNLTDIVKKINLKLNGYVYKIRHKKSVEAASLLLEKSGRMVFSGPFATMPIPPGILEGHERYLILGSYEECLHPEIYKLITSKPKFGVVVGAHKGYYVVGLLYSIENCFIISYEDSSYLQNILTDWAKHIDALDRLSINGHADVHSLKNIDQQPDFLIIDCEGNEDELLQPHLIPWLAQASIICELHDFYKPGLLSRLISRFAETHEIKIIESRPINASDYAILDDISRSEAEKCVKEDRWFCSSENTSKIFTAGRFMIAKPKELEQKHF